MEKVLHFPCLFFEFLTITFRADEIYVETMKDQVAAQNLLEEIETAKLYHPTARQSISFISRTDALIKRLSLRGNPESSTSTFPCPVHSLFSDQMESNQALTQALASEITSAMDLARKVNYLAEEYRTTQDAVKRVENLTEAARDLSTTFTTVINRLEEGVPSNDGDGTPPNLMSEECLEATRHSVFLALLPSILEERDKANGSAIQLLRSSRAALLSLDRSGIDPAFKFNAASEIHSLTALRDHAQSVRDNVTAGVGRLRKARKIWTVMDRDLKELEEIRRLVGETMDRLRWRQQTGQVGTPLTPESPPLAAPFASLSYTEVVSQLDSITFRLSQDVDLPLASLSRTLEAPLKNYLTQSVQGLKSQLESMKQMAHLLDSIQRQATVMGSIRDEFNDFQIRIEDLKIRFDSGIQEILSDKLANEDLTKKAVHLKADTKVIQDGVQTFIDGLSQRVPFVTQRSLPSYSSATFVRRRFSSVDLKLGASLQQTLVELPFDLQSLDEAVRADSNVFVMRLGGELQGLEQKGAHFQLARMAKEVDFTLISTTEDINCVSLELSTLKGSLSTIMDRSNVSEPLESLLKDFEYSTQTHRTRITRSFSPLRGLLRQMDSAPGAHDAPVHEVMYLARIRAVDDAELKFNAWSEDAAFFKNQILEAHRIEAQRLEEERLAEEHRLQRERERMAAEEVERARLEKERIEAEEKLCLEEKRMAEERRLLEEMERVAAEEAERARLEQERLDGEERLRLEEGRLAEKRRLLEESHRIAAEEAERIRLEQQRLDAEERLRLEEERLVQERRVLEERERIAAEEAETTRLERERLETEKKLCLEEQLAEERRLRTERERVIAEEAERARLAQERLQTENKLRLEEERLAGERRLQAERERTIAEEAERIRLEREQLEVEKKLKLETEWLAEERRLLVRGERLAAEEAEASRLAQERLRTDTNSGKSKGVSGEEAPAHSNVNFQELDEGRCHVMVSSFYRLCVFPDVFGLFVTPAETHRFKPQELSDLQTLIFSLRKRLRSISINDVSRPASKSSARLPSQEQMKRMNQELTIISGEVFQLPASTEDSSVDIELRSLKVEVDGSAELMKRVEKLANLSDAVHLCDAALSDLLEHIDSYPASPLGPLSSSHTTPINLPSEEQLLARLSFTRSAVEDMNTQFTAVADDSRAVAERKRILQTWSELEDMGNDRIGGKKSRPTSVISSGRDSSGRNSSGRNSSASAVSSRRPRKTTGYTDLSAESSSSRSRFLVPSLPNPRRAVSGSTELHNRPSSQMSSMSTNRSVSGPLGFSLHGSTFASRQRTTSLSASTSTPVRRSSGTPFSSRAQTGQSKRSGSPRFSDSSTYSHSVLGPSRSSTSMSTWSRAPRPSLSTMPRGSTPQRKAPVASRKTYIADPKSKLDVAVGDVVNKLPVGINIEGLSETWKDQSGKYWIGDQDPKLCFCRILRSQTVMVRVGGGWAELSKYVCSSTAVFHLLIWNHRFIKDHFADSFRLMPDSPPRVGAREEKWISSATLTEAPETPPLSPRTPEPKVPFVPSFSLSTPSGQSPQSLKSSPSTKGSPLTPLQFIRRADSDAPVLRPVTPSKPSILRTRNTITHTPARSSVWRP